MTRSLAPKIEAANSALMAEGNLDAVGEFFAPDYVVHLTDQDITGGHDAIRKILRMYRRAFPDLQVQVEILVEARDRVAWQRTLRATHRGDFKGFSATGRPLVWRDMVTSRFRGGLIAEDWLITDLAERLLLARRNSTEPDMNRKQRSKADRPIVSIPAYDTAQSAAEASVCRALRAEIERALPDATSKVWHGAPVWFVGETPVVGYNVAAKGGVVLLFWNGQAFGDPALKPIGKFKAAQTRFGDVSEIKVAPLRRWLKKAGTEIWDVSSMGATRKRYADGRSGRS